MVLPSIGWRSRRAPCRRRRRPLIVDSRRVEQVRAVDFLRLSEGVHQAEVARVELALVEVVVDGFASDRVAKADLDVFLIVDEAFASAGVERGLAAFGLQLREAEEPHFSGALQRHLRIVLREDLVVLRRNLLVLAFDAAQTRQEQVFDGCEIDCHCP
jgi:hypothetical protein